MEIVNKQMGKIMKTNKRNDAVEINPNDPECQPMKCDIMIGEFWGKCPICHVWSCTGEVCKGQSQGQGKK